MDFMLDFLKCYGLKGFDDYSEFCKLDLLEMETVQKLEDMLPEIILYYLPCKAKIYLNDITESRTVTILCQFLRLFDYELTRKERISNGNKVIYYKMQKSDDSRLHINSCNTYELLFK
jgi:hypothetical protein